MNTPTGSADKTAIEAHPLGITHAILMKHLIESDIIINDDVVVKAAMEEYATLRLTQAEEAHRKEIEKYELAVNVKIPSLIKEREELKNELQNIRQEGDAKAKAFIEYLRDKAGLFDANDYYFDFHLFYKK